MSIALLLSLLATIGADLLWLVALGDHLRITGALPEGVPFAAAPTDDWPPVLVLAEVVLSMIHELGVAGLLAWHYLAVLGALVVVALDARRRGASDLATALVLLALVLAGIATFAVVRLQTFSLVPFVLVLLLVRAQHRSPGRTMWWAPPLVVLWGNVHGTVLLGVCVIGAYLLLSRLPGRPVETVALGRATLAALFVNPAGWRTAEYYLGVLQNEAAQQGEGLWAAPDLGDPFHQLMLVGVVVLGVLALRRRLPLWEYVAVAGLAIATIVAARNGIWLLLLLAARAAYGGTRRPGRFTDLKQLPPARVVAVVGAVLVACGGPLVSGASRWATLIGSLLRRSSEQHRLAWCLRPSRSSRRWPSTACECGSATRWMRSEQRINAHIWTSWQGGPGCPRQSTTQGPSLCRKALRPGTRWRERSASRWSGWMSRGFCTCVLDPAVRRRCSPRCRWHRCWSWSAWQPGGHRAPLVAGAALVVAAGTVIAPLHLVARVLDPSPWSRRSCW